MTEQIDVAGLLDAASDWARRTFPAPDADGPACDHTQPATCAWCPVCRVVAVLRGERPELTARLVETGAAFAAAVKAVLDAPPATAPQAPPAPAPAPRVQRIDLGGS